MAGHIIELFTRPTCSDCQAAKEYLTKRQIPYTEYDVSNSPEKEALLKQMTGTRIVPAVVIRRPSFLGFHKKPKIWIGFEQNKEEIEAVLPRE